MVVKRDRLQNDLHDLLAVDVYADGCPNGLQVEGKEEIRVLISGVTASQALLDAAVLRGADAIVVHHGYFWKNDPRTVCGMRKRRLQTLLAGNINLFAYHLPLDIHPKFGNNAALAEMLGITATRTTHDGLVWYGTTDMPYTHDTFAQHISARLHRVPTVVSCRERTITRVAWCTGGGQSFLDDIAPDSADAFISGEISEQTTHSARERGIHYFACGHHATERYGVQRLGNYIAAHYGITHAFVDIDNPA